MNAQQIIASLNAMTLGDLASLLGKLAEARLACIDLGHESIAEVVEEARVALAAGDVTTYRRKVATALARLGHVKNG